MSLNIYKRLTALENRPTILAGAALTLNAVQHAGRLILLNIATGGTYVLPAATGTGNRYTFFTSVSQASGSIIIRVANATDVMQGVAAVAATTSGTFPTTTTSDTITFNATTQGGLRGSYVEIEDVAAGLFRVNVHTVGSGIAVTVFSATV
jgi:hypothetical protein